MCSGVSPDGGWSSSSSCPAIPFWVGHPGPPGVQEPARPPPPAVPGAAGARPCARAEGRLPRLIDLDADVGAAS